MTNVDVCASIVESSVFLGDPKASEFAFRLIQQIANDADVKKNMRIRLYIAICAFFYNTIGNSPLHDRLRLFTEGIGWARSLIAYQKTNENGYYWEAKFLLLGNKRDEAENCLRSCIYDPPDPAQDTLGRLRCPRCCKLYLEHFLLEKGSFDQLEEIVIKGLSDCVILNQDLRSDYTQYFAERLQALNDSRRINDKFLLERKNTNGQRNDGKTGAS